MDLSRRGFIKASTAVAAAGAALTGAEARAATDGRVQIAQATTAKPIGFNPADPGLKYELVIAGGEVLDPSQKLRRHVLELKTTLDRVRETKPST